MKKVLIFYIIMTIILAFALSILVGSKKEPAEYIVTDSEIEEYKKTALKYSPNLTEEQLNESVNSYFEGQKQVYESKADNTNKGMSFGSALKLSAIISAIIIVILGIVNSFKTAHYNQLWGESKYGKMGDLYRAFFGFSLWDIFGRKKE